MNKEYYESLTSSAVIPAHICTDNSKVISCDGENDVCKCKLCGKEWKEPCSFDDNYN